ncbi:7TM-DISM domain-containing protein [Candidatus Burkholderia verschuerenii]|uniref:7TM-DISM domain-containing protein n=1 Tax=Candidatus Burkholderia verschuerenii TaxID=242163 RepID=UPI000A93DD64|nr:7TM-DISM domain-containing protein [Candidatus Burkholderia verschuerenii]
MAARGSTTRCISSRYTAVPILIALGTIATLVFLPRQYESRGAKSLAIAVVSDHNESFTPADALAALRHAQPVSNYSTRLSEKPIWFSFTTPSMSAQSQTVVELPSRHAQTLACWNAATLQPLGRADRDSTSGDMKPVKAGFFILTGPLSAPEPILCRGTYSGPAQVNAFAWDWQGLRNSSLDFQESSGLIAGGLLTLAVFVFVTALINHEWTYVIFAVWLVGNLRLCANAMGWDMQWLGRMLPSEYMTPLRQLTFAAYYLLTAALFTQLFRRELRVVGYRWLLRVIQYVGLVLLAAALALPYSLFIPTLWIIAGFGIFVLLFFLTRLVWMARSRTVMWYVASLAIVLFTTFSEVLGAAFGLKVLVGRQHRDGRVVVEHDGRVRHCRADARRTRLPPSGADGITQYV